MNTSQEKSSPSDSTYYLVKRGVQWSSDQAAAHVLVADLKLGRDSFEMVQLRIFLPTRERLLRALSGTDDLQEIDAIPLDAKIIEFQRGVAFRILSVAEYVQIARQSKAPSA